MSRSSSLGRYLLEAILIVALAGCGGDSKRSTAPVDGTPPPDQAPPAAVSNLAVTATTATSVTLSWTAPGDDGTTGQATRYEVRYSTDSLAEPTWASATAATGVPAPQSAGLAETFTVAGLITDTPHHFALKAVDEADNRSAISNVVLGTPAGPQPVCEVSLTSLDFDSIEVGGTRDLTFILRNAGGGALAVNVTSPCPAFPVISGGGPRALGAGQADTVTVRFAPVSAGYQTCTIDTGIPACGNVVCSGEAITAPLPPACRVEPTSLDFGSVAIGAADTLSFIVTNTGGGTLTGSIAETCAEFELIQGQGPFGLAAGASTTVKVRYTPIAVGTNACTIETGAGLCASVGCTGIAVGVPACVVAPTSLDFGTVPVGETSSRTFTITNSGTGYLPILPSAPGGVFQITGGDGPRNLGPGESATVTVRFAPVIGESQSGTLSTGSALCEDVVCHGVGFEPPPVPLCWIDTISLDFGTVPLGGTAERSFAITNGGEGTLTCSVSESSPEFEIIQGQGSFDLTAGVTQTVIVRFAPVSAGSQTCTIETGTELCEDIGCTGIATGVPLCEVGPMDLNFAPVVIGDAADQSFTIHNFGTADLPVNVRSLSEPFSILNGGGARAISPGDSAVVTVRFAPTAIGQHTAMVDTGSEACPVVFCAGYGDPLPLCDVSPTSLGFGNLPVGSTSDLYFVINNSGGGVVSGTVPASCGAFTVFEGSGPFNLAAGDYLTVGVRFAPTLLRDESCSLDLGLPCGSIPCVGAGVEPPPPPGTVSVSFGPFLMGNNPGEFYADESPMHTLYLADYRLGIYEVTHAQYVAALNWASGQGLLVIDDTNPYRAVNLAAQPHATLLYMYRGEDATHCPITYDGSLFAIEPGWENRPAVWVSWYGAAAYCNWQSTRESREPCYSDDWTCSFDHNGYRLPTEAEWEKAARGPVDDRDYPWGESADCSHSNYAPGGSGAGACVGHTVDVDDAAYGGGASHYGALHLAGNVMEWVNDWYDAAYYAVSPTDDPRGPDTGSSKIMRGGSWWDGPDRARCSRRLEVWPGQTLDRLGFRVALTAR